MPELRCFKRREEKRERQTLVIARLVVRALKETWQPAWIVFHVDIPARLAFRVAAANAKPNCPSKPDYNDPFLSERQQQLGHQVSLWKLKGPHEAGFGDKKTRQSGFV